MGYYTNTSLLALLGYCFTRSLGVVAVLKTRRMANRLLQPAVLTGNTSLITEELPIGQAAKNGLWDQFL